MKLLPPVDHMGAVALVFSVGCLIPTDRGGDLHVRITGGMPTMLATDTVRLTVDVVDGGGVTLGNVVAVLSSNDTTVLTVDDAGLVRAIGPGEAHITASTPQYADAQSDTVAVSVFAGIGQGIVRFEPSTPRFGEILTIVGLSLDPDSIDVLLIGGISARVSRHVPSVEEGGFDSLLIWAPPPAPPASDLVIVRRGGGSALFPLTVLQRDIYEPNDTVPDSPDESVVLPGALTLPFFNPALAFEPGVDFGPSLTTPVWFDPVSIDLYLFQAQPDGAGDVSIVFTAQTPTSLDEWELVEVVVGGSSVSPHSLHFRCNGLRFDTDSLQSPATRLRPGVDPQVVALKGVNPLAPDIGFPFLVGTARRDVDSSLTPYSLDVREGYVAEFPPDAWEENDFCDLAETLPTADSTVLDDLTFDNRGDLDWYRVVVEGAATELTVRAGSPDAAFTAPEILLFEEAFHPDAPFSWSDLEELPLVSRSATGADSLSATLPPGNYLLLAVNVFTSPGPYTLSVIRSAAAAPSGPAVSGR